MDTFAPNTFCLSGRLLEWRWKDSIEMLRQRLQVLTMRRWREITSDDLLHLSLQATLTSVLLPAIPESHSALLAVRADVDSR